jgi:hypothetical protein
MNAYWEELLPSFKQLVKWSRIQAKANFIVMGQNKIEW